MQMKIKLFEFPNSLNGTVILVVIQARHLGVVLNSSLTPISITKSCQFYLLNIVSIHFFPIFHHHQPSSGYHLLPRLLQETFSWSPSVSCFLHLSI